MFQVRVMPLHRSFGVNADNDTCERIQVRIELARILNATKGDDVQAPIQSCRQRMPRYVFAA